MFVYTLKTKISQMRTLILIAGLIISQIGFSQPKVNEIKFGSIKGEVIDEILNEPLPYVTILIKNNLGDTIKGGITNEKGIFDIDKIPLGEVLVEIQYIGFKTVTKTLNIVNGNFNINIGKIFLEEEIDSLDEVTVVAEVSTIQQKVDRKVINVGKDLTTTGPTASDIMNNIPSVSIDQQTGNISLRGNQNVTIMVDGKLSNIPPSQLLQQLPSNSIKTIELITNPSAKYNPDGMSGIINIVLKKNANIGFNGNINLGYTYEKYPKFNSSLDLNYRNGKFNLYGSYANNIAEGINYGVVNRLEQESTQYFNFFNDNNSHVFKVGLDYYIDDNNTISFFTNQNLFDSTFNSKNDLDYIDEPRKTQNFDADTENSSSQFNLAYSRKTKKEGEKIDLEIDYNYFDNNEFVDFTHINFEPLPDYSDQVDTERQSWTVNFDYVNPLSEKTTLEAGLQLRTFNNDMFYESDGISIDPTIPGSYIPTPSTIFNYQRYIYSGYGNLKSALGKFNYQLGLRIENVNESSKAEIIGELSNQTLKNTFDYFKVYPSLFVTYAPTEKGSYQLSYSRRVDRPGVGQVNPIRNWTTPLVSQIGNPNLKPQFTNSIETNYTKNLKKGSLTAGVFFRIIEDEINTALLIDRLDVNRIILSDGNFDNTTAYGIEISSAYKLAKWWQFNASFDYYAQTQKGVSEELTKPVDEATVYDIVRETVEVDNVLWNFRINNSFSASKRLKFSLFTMYRGEEKGIQITRKPMFMVNTGMRYTLFDNKATLSVNYNDIFDTMKMEFETDRPFAQNGEFNWESNTWYVGFSFRFGGGKYRALQRKRRDNNEKSGGGFM